MSAPDLKIDINGSLEGLGDGGDNEELVEAINKQASVQKKAGKEIAKSIRKVAKSNQEIATSILSASNNLLSGLSMISDEMERKRKSDEYYFLRKEITCLEDTLLEWGFFEEAYKKMELKQVPTIELQDEDCAILAILYDEGGMEELKSAVKRTMCSPYTIIDDLLNNGPEKYKVLLTYTIKMSGLEDWEDPVNALKTKPEKHFYEVEASIPKLNMKVLLESLNFKARHNDELVDWDPLKENSDFHSTIHTTVYSMIDGMAYPCFIDSPLLPMTADENIFATFVYNARGKLMRENKEEITERLFIPDIPPDGVKWLLDSSKEALKRLIREDLNLWQARIGELQDFFESVNRDIILLNLRNLHQQLQSQVRNYKIQRYTKS